MSMLSPSSHLPGPEWIAHGDGRTGLPVRSLSRQYDRGDPLSPAAGTQCGTTLSDRRLASELSARRPASPRSYPSPPHSVVPPARDPSPRLSGSTSRTDPHAVLFSPEYHLARCGEHPNSAHGNKSVSPQCRGSRMTLTAPSTLVPPCEGGLSPEHAASLASSIKRASVVQGSLSVQLVSRKAPRTALRHSLPGPGTSSLRHTQAGHPPVRRSAARSSLRSARSRSRSKSKSPRRRGRKAIDADLQGLAEGYASGPVEIHLATLAASQKSADSKLRTLLSRMGDIESSLAETSAELGGISDSQAAAERASADERLAALATIANLEETVNTLAEQVADELEDVRVSAGEAAERADSLGRMLQRYRTTVTAPTEGSPVAASPQHNSEERVDRPVVPQPLRPAEWEEDELQYTEAAVSELRQLYGTAETLKELEAVLRASAGGEIAFANAWAIRQAMSKPLDDTVDPTSIPLLQGAYQSDWAVEDSAFIPCGAGDATSNVVMQATKSNASCNSTVDSSLQLSHQTSEPAIVERAEMSIAAAGPCGMSHATVGDSPRAVEAVPSAPPSDVHDSTIDQLCQRILQVQKGPPETPNLDAWQPPKTPWQEASVREATPPVSSSQRSSSSSSFDEAYDIPPLTVSESVDSCAPDEPAPQPPQAPQRPVESEPRHASPTVSLEDEPSPRMEQLPNLSKIIGDTSSGLELNSADHLVLPSAIRIFMARSQSRVSSEDFKEEGTPATISVSPPHLRGAPLHFCRDSGRRWPNSMGSTRSGAGGGYCPSVAGRAEISKDAMSWSIKGSTYSTPRTGWVTNLRND